MHEGVRWSVSALIDLQCSAILHGYQHGADGCLGIVLGCYFEKSMALCGLILFKENL